MAGKKAQQIDLGSSGSAEISTSDTLLEVTVANDSVKIKALRALTGIRIELIDEYDDPSAPLGATYVIQCYKRDGEGTVAIGASFYVGKDGVTLYDSKQVDEHISKMEFE